MASDARTVVEELFAAMGAGDTETVARLLDDDIRFSTGGATPLSGVAEGKAAVFEKMQKVSAVTGGNQRLEAVAVTGAGPELALVHARRHASVGGDSITAELAMVARVRDGRVVEVADVMDSALESFWSRVL